jgi:enamine deaminase RidA (YjgF/YER057c/UK114 family)
MSQPIEYINPDGLSKNPAFSQLVITQGNGKTIYIGGQNAVTADGELVGKGDLSAQTEQVMQNLQTALAACNASFEDVVKLTINLVQGHNLYDGFQVAQRYLSPITNRPTISVLVVVGLANPDYLIEIDAIAFVAH